MIETTPDVVPRDRRSTGVAGLPYRPGFSGHGFGIGPGAGKAIAALLTGDDVGLSLGEFRLSPFLGRDDDTSADFGVICLDCLAGASQPDE